MVAKTLSHKKLKWSKSIGKYVELSKHLKKIDCYCQFSGIKFWSSPSTCRGEKPCFFQGVDIVRINLLWKICRGVVLWIHFMDEMVFPKAILISDLSAIKILKTNRIFSRLLALSEYTFPFPEPTWAASNGWKLVVFSRPLLKTDVQLIRYWPSPGCKLF